MFKVTRYCVQVFERERPPDAARQFRDKHEALEVGRLASRRAMGVLVYEVSGEPISDLWRDPILLAKFGRPPRELGLRRARKAERYPSRGPIQGIQHAERGEPRNKGAADLRSGGNVCQLVIPWRVR